MGPTLTSEQVIDCAGCIENLTFSKEELRQIEQYTLGHENNLLKESSEESGEVVEMV